MKNLFLVAAFLLTAALSQERLPGRQPGFRLPDESRRDDRTQGIYPAAGTHAAGRAECRVQRKSIESIKANTHTWEELTRKSVVAPFVFQITNDAERPHGIARRIDLWFIAYGDLKTLGNEEFLKQQFKSATTESDAENGSSSKQLTESELARHGMKASQRLEDPEYTVSQFSLLEHVRLSVTTRATGSETKNSLLSASVLDARFNGDTEYPNQWRPITRDNEGRRVIVLATVFGIRGLREGHPSHRTGRSDLH